MLVKQKRKPKYAVAYGIIIGIAIVFVFLILLFSFTYGAPKNLEQTTGTVAKFNQYDKTWIDDIGGASPSHFRVRLKDGTAFTTPDAVYDHIDRTLFEDLRAGEEITITHNRGKIYAIEYRGKTYLSLDTALHVVENNKKGMRILGLSFSGAIIVLCGLILFLIEYRRRKNAKTPINPLIRE